MPKRFVRFLAPLLILLALPALGGKPPFEDELGSDPAKIADDDVDLSMMNGNGDGDDSGRGPRPYLKAMGAPPARIGLISFIVRDCGNRKENSWNTYGGSYTYHVTSTRTRNVNEYAMDMLANELHDVGVPALREALATVGSQLLTPAEFLDSDARREAYGKYEIERGMMESFYRRLISKDSDDFRFAGIPTGYRLLELTSIFNVKQNKFELATTGIGVGNVAQTAGHDLAQALGVDAVAFVYNIVQAQKKAIVMRGSYAYLFGPNPVPDKGQSLYWRGHQYSGVYLKMDDIEFIETDRDGKLVQADYAGYAIVAKALGLKMAAQLKENSGWDGTSKPKPIPGFGAPAAAPPADPNSKT